MDSKLKSLVWLNRSKANRSGVAPLYIRITKGKRKIEIATGLFILPEYWSIEKNKVLNGFKTASQINQSLDAFRRRIAQVQFEILLKDEYFDLDKIKELILGKTANDKTLLQAIRYHNEMIAAQIGKGYSIGTLKRFEYFELKVKRFLKTEYEKSDILLADLNHIFLERFINFMKVVDHNAPYTVFKNVTCLKKIINLAVDYDWLLKSPFKRIKLEKGNTERTFLNLNELISIVELVIENKSLYKIRDMFLLQCYTGLAFADLINLSSTHIVTGIDGRRWISMRRQKTKSSFSVPILPPAQAIIDKYLNGGDTVFPRISNQKYNKGLKKLMKTACIGKSIASHAGRRTFATTVALRNGVPIESISKMLGHSDLSVTQMYSIVDDRKLAADMNPLFEKFNAISLDKKIGS